MNLKFFLLVLEGFIFFLSQASPEYIYPVAALYYNNENHFYLIHQAAPDKLDLLLWNPRTKETHKVLLSRFNPSGLQLLPEQNGFSFIDNDILFLKMDEKRSPHCIDFSEPLYDLTRISWIDNKTFYCSAHYHKTFGIYQASVQGHSDCFIASEHHDCLYPQKVDDVLFFIERDRFGVHIIKSIPYPNIVYRTIDPVDYLNNQKTTHRAYKEYDTLQKTTIYSMQKHSIAFLKMLNKKEGFFIEHPNILEKNMPIITFSYHHIQRDDDDQWHDRILFSFSLPVHFLIRTSTTRLYESIVPFLPRHILHGDILFFDCISYPHSDQLSIFLYNQKSSARQSVDFDKCQCCIGALEHDMLVYAGGIVEHADEKLPKMWIEEGKLCVELAYKNILYVS